MANYKFDLDIVDGEEGESLANYLRLTLCSSKIEVKRDMLVGNTGNVAIEFECRGKPSGIATTEAHWWAIILDGKGYQMGRVVFLRTDVLRNIARRYYSLGKIANGGDDGLARMVLVPVAELVARDEQKLFDN